MHMMNPILRELGFQATDRVAVVHADDIGMCHATLPAIDELMALGLVTSASVMVPCPWFLDAVAWHRQNPDYDLGIHLTLTSEWARYRWGPISTRAEASGLLDDRGYLHSTTAAVRRLARREAVKIEMRSQIDLATRSGLAPSHIDNHMFVAMCDEFAASYLQLGCECGIPSFMARTRLNVVNETDWFQEQAMKWENRGQPVFDYAKVVTSSGVALDHEEYTRQVFARLPPGLSCVLLHPAVDTPEIRHITGDWRARVADFETFRRSSLLEYVRGLGIQLISYRPLRDMLRKKLNKRSIGD
jgi:predicted glycoside hydrolase/deacetylase ChbG (UPF0249 family)